jgi:NHLM bacteriocin system ABC transporter ATP-binding protein
MWTLGPERAIRPAQALAWVWAVEGEAFICGAMLVPGAGATPLPVSLSCFITATAPATLQAVSTETLLASGAEGDALARTFTAFGEAFLPRIAAEISHAREADTLQLSARQSASRTLWQRARDRLSRAIEDAAPIAPASRWDDDPVFQAVAVLAGETGARENAPAGENAIPAGIRDRLEAIGRASRFRFRNIELAGRWWEGDVEPCLGMYAGEKEGGEPRPVALLPRSGLSGGAVMVDPATGAKTPIDKAAAQRILPSAYALHWLLPAEPLTAWSLLRFACAGKMAQMGTIVLAAIIGALIGFVMPVITGAVVGHVIPTADFGQLGQLLALLFGAAIASFSFALMRTLTLLRMQGMIDGRLQTALWDRLLSMPAPFFSRMTAGDLANRALGINWISTVLGGPLLGAVVAGVASVLSLIIMVYYSWRLTLVAAAVIVVGIICAAVMVRAMIRGQRELYARQGKLLGKELQLLSAASKFQVSCATPRVFANWAEHFAQVMRGSYHAALPQCYVTVFGQVFQPLSLLAMLFAIVFFAKTIATPDFVAFNAAFGQFVGLMVGLIAALVTAAEAVPIYERARPVLTTIPEDAAGKADPGQLTGAISLRDIRFRYSAEGHAVLDGLNLDIRSGEYVAIVGPSGAGKSTLLRLLLGFERAELGEIAYDGKALDDIDPYLLRRQIGVVMQMGRLTPASIFDNIANHGHFTLDDAWEAAEQAGLADTIRRMPMKMQTYVAEGSSTLSGGERQRLLIARAFVRKARILLFDEATSALDNETQAIVTRSLSGLTSTRIVIAHRLSTIEKVDRIVVLNNGRVSEQGSFHELMERRGDFYELAKRQLA